MNVIVKYDEKFLVKESFGSNFPGNKFTNLLMYKKRPDQKINKHWSVQGFEAFWSWTEQSQCYLNIFHTNFQFRTKKAKNWEAVGDNLSHL